MEDKKPFAEETKPKEKKKPGRKRKPRPPIKITMAEEGKPIILQFE
jgi:hypothetical protein